MREGLGSVVNGYALSKDGLWRQHSWLVTPEGGLVETTVRRAAYFGAVLAPEEVKAEYGRISSKTATKSTNRNFVLSDVDTPNKSSDVGVFLKDAEGKTWGHLFAINDDGWLRPGDVLIDR